MDSGHGSLTGLVLAPRDGLLRGLRPLGLAGARLAVRCALGDRHRRCAPLSSNRLVFLSAVRIRSDEQWIAVMVH